jgi:hypothetical protein
MKITKRNLFAELKEGLKDLTLQRKIWTPYSPPPTAPCAQCLLNTKPAEPTLQTTLQTLR